MASSYDLERRSDGHFLALTTLVTGVVALLAWSAMRQPRRPIRRVSDAPQRAFRDGPTENFRERTVVGRVVTINRPRRELYEYWRDLSRLPTFMENINRVEVLDQRRSRWFIAAPGGSEVTFETTITEERPNELIAWQSDEAAAVRNSGRISFRDAPGGRGTYVEALIAYDPPGGRIGQLAAKLFQREPNVQARRDLKRFKQLMETGEIATAEPGPAAPRAEE